MNFKIKHQNRINGLEPGNSANAAMSAGPGDPPSKFNLMKSTMEKKLSEVDQKIGGTHSGDTKKRKIRGTFEASMKKEDPNAWEEYQAKKVDPSTQYDTENVHGDIVSRQGREGTQDRKKTVRYISK